jgi:hypothetical protein
MTEIVTETLQDTTFFKILQSTPLLDLRDERGKELNLPVFLMGLLVALLRHKDGNLSRIYRSMKNKHTELLLALGVYNERVVSRSHLPILLKKVSGDVFSSLVFEHFGIALSQTTKEWFGIDGKELRGSILAGHTRGQAVVPVVRHSDKSVFVQHYYNGSKESERPTVAHLLATTGVGSQNVSLDALHFVPTTLEVVVAAGGNYLVGLKENQTALLTVMSGQMSKCLSPDFELISQEKGHGRQEMRHYKCLNIEDQCIDQRWCKSNLCTLIAVNRMRLENKRGKYSQEIALYMSNIKASTKVIANDLFDAIRGHWSSEVYNNVRDTTLAEDNLKTSIKEVSTNLSICRTLVISILNKIKPVNMAALLDDFSDDFQLLIRNLKTIRVL